MVYDALHSPQKSSNATCELLSHMYCTSFYLFSSVFLTPPLPPSSPASFYGDGFVQLKAAESSDRNTLRIRFRTSSANGLLFLAAGRTDYFLVELHTGRLQVDTSMAPTHEHMCTSRHTHRHMRANCTHRHWVLCTNTYAECIHKHTHKQTDLLKLWYVSLPADSVTHSSQQHKQTSKARSIWVTSIPAVTCHSGNYGIFYASLALCSQYFWLHIKILFIFLKFQIWFDAETL